MFENFILNVELDDTKFVDIKKCKEKHIKNSIIVIDINYFENNYFSMLENDNTIILINENINGIISNKIDVNKVYLFDLKKRIANNKRESFCYDFDSEQIFILFSSIDLQKYLHKFKYSKKLNYTNVIIKSTFYTFVEYLHFINNYLKTDCELLNKRILLLEEKLKDYNEIVKDNEQITNEIKQYKNDIDILKKSYNEIINSSSWKLTSIYRKIGFYIKKKLKTNRKKEE